VAALIDEEIKSIVSDAYEEAKRILTRQRGKMDLVVDRLKMVETIDARELDEILARPIDSSAQEIV
jgi:cell division protease FtsH